MKHEQAGEVIEHSVHRFSIFRNCFILLRVHLEGHLGAHHARTLSAECSPQLGNESFMVRSPSNMPDIPICIHNLGPSIVSKREQE
jgi:hypothetical protein